MSGTKVVKVTFFVSDSPSHDFYCTYLGFFGELYSRYGQLIVYSKNLYLIITNYSKMILHLRQRNLVAQYPLS